MIKFRACPATHPCFYRIRYQTYLFHSLATPCLYPFLQIT